MSFKFKINLTRICDVYKNFAQVFLEYYFLLLNYLKHRNMGFKNIQKNQKEEFL